eukprot:TRINITY_DN961_c0_g5_i6.p1 TRINITY_DN961_c0_g5~~TRINITY_DN961_c0_g5_i6.p1  ORF type:complete len:109 (+),score=32.69 TRINITY_DN961_c0_g5_i6:40-327(+)
MSRGPVAGKVFVGGLDERVTKEDLEDFCKGIGRLQSVWVARKPPGFGFVVFEDPRDAEDCVRDLDGKELLNRPVRVELSDGRRRTGRDDEKCFGN